MSTSVAKMAVKERRHGRGGSRELRDLDKNFNESVGERLRAARLSLGLSQTELAQRLGLSYQQVQKYEVGTNGLSLSRALQMAGALGITLDRLMPDAPQPTASGEGQDPMALDRGTRRMARLYHGLPSRKRALVKQFAELLSNATLDESDDAEAA
ncbi:MAG: helix-turn-helix transcriptional regulator [Tistlia sp.]|uniref:helix-turn-helix domain-containing protein n=1 Tax=Tistlia sp. TaxID=3057121 RepID=UPI0034A30B30